MIRKAHVLYYRRHDDAEERPLVVSYDLHLQTLKHKHWTVNSGSDLLQFTLYIHTHEEILILF